MFNVVWGKHVCPFGFLLKKHFHTYNYCHQMPHTLKQQQPHCFLSYGTNCTLFHHETIQPKWQYNLKKIKNQGPTIQLTMLNTSVFMGKMSIIHEHSKWSKTYYTTSIWWPYQHYLTFKIFSPLINRTPVILCNIWWLLLCFPIYSYMNSLIIYKMVWMNYIPYHLKGCQAVT